jgi:hypothetical protein
MTHAMMRVNIWSGRERLGTREKITNLGEEQHGPDGCFHITWLHCRESESGSQQYETCSNQNVEYFSLKQ